MKNKRFLFKISLVSSISLLLLTLISVGSAFAYSKYYSSGYDYCVSRSGGRGSFWSVQYACHMAICDWSKTPDECNAARGQNGCSGWLGPAGDSNSKIIKLSAPSENAVISGLGFWGMCTDANDTTNTVYVIPAGPGSPGGHGVAATGVEEKNFFRTKNWGSPSFTPTNLHVHNFIQGLTPAIVNGQKVYTRQVYVDRQHSNNPSMGLDMSTIILTIGDVEPETDNLCESWTPDAYTDSDEDDGHTRIVVKAKNTAGRFPVGESGDWHHNNDDENEFSHTDYVGEIYAMPTDNIEWHSCYYPGVQMTAESDVSDIDDIIVAGGTDGKWVYEPNPLPSDECLGYSPKVGYKMLWKAYEGDKIGKDWQNKYKIHGDLGGASGGDFGPGNYNEEHNGLSEADIQRGGNYRTGTLKGSDTGKKLTETGETGKPKDVSIDDETPEDQDIYENIGHCCGTSDEKAEGAPCCTDDEYAEWVKTHPGLTDAGHCAKLVCTNSYENEILSATVTEGPAKDTATVLVPYNFKNSTGVKLASGKVYSGETVKVKEVWVKVGTRHNGKTYADYATVVPKAEVRFFMYVSEDDDGGGEESDDASCDDIDDAKQCTPAFLKNKATIKLSDLNAEGSLSGTEDSSEDESGVGTKLRENFVGTYDAFDASAGDYICFVMAVTPYTNTSDTEVGDTAGDGTWKFGTPACKVIYKRPTFQVWGGSLYSQAGVVGNVSKKRNFYYDYFSSPTNLCKGDTCFELHGSTVTYLTPWVEEGLIINDGLTSTVASGAATGYNPGNIRRAGNPNNSFCKYRAPLSFSNSSDTCDMTVKSTGNAQINSGVTKRDNLIQYWVGTNPSDVADDGECSAVWGGNCKKIKSASKETIKYIEGDDLTVTKKTINKRNTFLVDVKGTVNITGDIKYKDDEPYSMLAEIPKVIIYAKNINISCKVNEVDAILITKADGKVNTCSEYTSDSDEPNAKARARQLKIFGVVMADKIYLGRTYGAAAWDGRKIDGVRKTADAEAAEVFDYDSTIPMWSEYMSGSVETDTLQIVYQHELAPRY